METNGDAFWVAVFDAETNVAFCLNDTASGELEDFEDVGISHSRLTGAIQIPIGICGNVRSTCFCQKEQKGENGVKGEKL